MPSVKSGEVEAKVAKLSPKAVRAKREILYQEISADIARGDNAITVKRAKELLGWSGEPKGGKWERDFLLRDGRGKKVRCTNNTTNRPIYNQVLLTLKQEHLRRRWVFNAEPVIIGNTGLLLNGQHTLISLILAAQEWEDNREKWESYWAVEPVMDKLIVFGVGEDDKTVNTMDTCKSRSLVDVLCRSEFFNLFFSSLRPHDYKTCARTVDYAVRLLWHRTGAGLDAFAPRRTHAESLGFITRHPKLLECAKHIYEENGPKNLIGTYVSPGYAAGLLYLMGSMSTPAEDYYHAEIPSEEILNWDAYPQACEFFTLLAQRDKSLVLIKEAIASTISAGGGSNAERWGIIINAWAAFHAGEKITQETLALQYDTDDEGIRHLVEHPTIGGIDLGNPSEADETMIRGPDPSQEEIKHRASEVRDGNGKKAKTRLVDPRKALTRKPHQAGDDWASGDTAWVRDPDGEHYLGTLLETPEEGDDNISRVMVSADDGDWEVVTSDLSLERPEAIVPKPPMPRASSPADKKPKLKPSKAFSTWKAGQTAWIQERTGEPWKGRLVEINSSAKVARVKVETGFQGAGTIRVTKLSDLRGEQPAKPTRAF